MQSARRPLQLALATLLVAPLPQAYQRPSASVQAWEHESSDLSVNPRIRFGHLENGLRYAWMANAEPKQRCYIRLHVDVGAFEEEDAENGMAHFLEHMAFNGSKHFPAGTLVEWFQEHGMEFGADLNATTTHDRTVYLLDLPNSDEETLREALTVLRDWADGLLLEQAEVDKEKGVIDGEEAAGDSPGRRVFDRILEQQYAGTRYTERDVIGEKETRAAFDAKSVRAFYERWYRPEVMTLAIVGDLGKLDPEALIAESFADIAAPARPVEPQPAIGTVKPVQRFFSIHEPEIPSVQISLERLVPYEDEPDTLATRTDDIDLACARRMLNLRFSELVKQEGTPFLSANVSSAGGLEVYDGEALFVASEPDKWAQAYAAADRELRRALTYGFQEAELAEVRADWLRSLEEAVEREATRDSRSFMGELMSACDNRYVPTDAQTELELSRPLIEALTVEACQEALVEAWDAGVVNLFTAGKLDLGDGAAEKLAGLWTSARESEVEQSAEVAVEAFAYAAAPDKAGAFAAEAYVEDLDAWLFRFENGVQLNVKRTDFKERQIVVSARLGEGLLAVAPEDFATGWMATQAAVNLAGLGAHSVDELRRLTAGRRVGLGFGWSNDAFTLAGATTDEDLQLQLELLCAQLSDPGWRDDGIRLMRERIPLIFEQLAHVSNGPLVLEFLPRLFHGDVRFCELPPRAALEAVDMDDVRACIAPQFANGPLEVTIVGDLELEAVKTAAARTLGLLPARRAPDPATERKKAEAPAAGLRMERTVETESDKSLVFLAFPIPDGLVAERRRSLKFLSQVVQDRLRLEVREKLGAAYSPGASAVPNEVFPGIGLLMIQATLEPEKVDTLVAACLAVAKELQENGVTEEEVARLSEPTLAQIRDAKRTNGFWIQGLGTAQTRPETLDDVRSIESFYASIEVEPISALAARYLAPERASLLIVNPASAVKDAEATEAGAGSEGK